MIYSNIRARARESLRGNWGISVGAAFVAAIFSALVINSGNVLEVTHKLAENFSPRVAAVLGLLVSAVSTLSIVRLVLSGVIQLGYTKFLLAQQDGKEYEIKDLFSQFHRFTVGFLQTFLRGLYIVLWSLLLFIPGIIKSLSYAMTPFILTDHPELTASQAIRRSMELMQGHKWDLFVLNLTFLGWELLNALTLGIGSFWLNPYKNAAYAAFYREITTGSRETYVEF